MRIFVCLVIVPVLVPICGCGRSAVTAGPRQSSASRLSTNSDPWEVAGKTQPTPHGIARIAPVPLHPVEKVHVEPGKRVKKGELLVEIDADEPKADVRAKEAGLKEMEAGLERLKREPRKQDQEEARATLESARITNRHARELLTRLEPAWLKGALPDQRYYEARTNLLRSAADERAARARLDRLLKRPVEWEIAEIKAKIATARANLEAAKAELEHYTLTAPINGVISWLDVCEGTVSRPGTTVWGEILDLRQIDVRCDLTPEQADRVVKDQSAEVISGQQTFAGKVVRIGIAADQRTGRIPAIIRIDKANERLRCYVPVKVRFASGS